MGTVLSDDSVRRAVDGSVALPHWAWSAVLWRGG